MRKKIETPPEKRVTAFYKVNDWYSKHNFGTRLALIVFLCMFILTVINSLGFIPSEFLDDNVTTPIPEASGLMNSTELFKIEILKITGYFALAMATLVTLGDNALTKIGDIIVKVKGGKKDNSI